MSWCITSSGPAAAAVVIAGLSGVRHLRKLVAQHGYRVVQLGRGEYCYD